MSSPYDSETDSESAYESDFESDSERELLEQRQREDPCVNMDKDACYCDMDSKLNTCLGYCKTINRYCKRAINRFKRDELSYYCTQHNKDKPIHWDFRDHKYTTENEEEYKTELEEIYGNDVPVNLLNSYVYNEPIVRHTEKDEIEVSLTHKHNGTKVVITLKNGILLPTHRSTSDITNDVYYYLNEPTWSREDQKRITQYIQLAPEYYTENKKFPHLLDNLSTIHFKFIIFPVTPETNLYVLLVKIHLQGETKFYDFKLSNSTNMDKAAHHFYNTFKDIYNRN